MECQECLFYGFFGAVIFMASLHGFLLAAIFLFSKKLNSRSNKFLTLALLGICVILGYESVAYLSDYDSIPLFIQYLPLYITTTIPVGIYFFVCYLIDPNHRLTNFGKFAYIAIGLEVFLYLMYLPSDLFFKEESQMEYAESIIDWTTEFIGIFTSLVLLPVALLRVNRYQKFLFNNFSTTNNKSLAWLRNFLILCLLLLPAWIISSVQYLSGYELAGDYTYGVVTLFLIGMLFWIGYFVILEYSWFEIVPVKSEKAPDKLPGNRLSIKTDVYHQNLKELMQKESLFEDVDLTLESLAQKLNISSGYLSQIIKEKEQKNFFEFVNYYRIAAVKEKLLDHEYRNYTIMAIAIESGFKSKSTFNSVFKKFTGYTPSAYKKSHLKNRVRVS